MESVVYEDSPLAEILDASGGDTNDTGWLSDSKIASPTTHDFRSFCFAPRGFPKAILTSREKGYNVLPVRTISKQSRLANLGRNCLDTFRWRIGQSEKASALEQLRYTIIGSQLLSDRAPNGLSRRLIIAKRQSTTRNEGQSGDPQYTTRGLLITGCSAFACALSIWWATKPSNGRLSKTRISFICAILLAASLLVYGLFVRQFRRHARSRAIEAASQLVSNALVFDSNAHAAITLIQEVELVSRGYRLSSPLPPASRLEDGKDQARRCARLRRTLRLALDSITSPHVEAYHSLRPFVNEVDLDRYFDMYELSRTDIGEVEESLADRSEADDLESIRILKVDLHRLFTARKMFLSAILALDADTKPNKLDWTLMTDIMESISGITAVATSSLEGVIGEEERFSIPPSPRTPLTPGRERLQHQVRKFTTLSQGLRGLQAKMHILREDSDKALGSSDDVMALGSSLLEQYDAFGSDLRALVADWEEGRSALTASIGKHERRMSLNSTGMIFSRSPTPSSLGGITEVGGSPPEAFKILAGDPMSRLDAASSDEEIFEAMASPRPRSTLTRDERLAKMKEDRAKLASARERIDASRFMVKELETVIKARPRGRTSGRVTSI